jgi:hypothetical protein
MARINIMNFASGLRTHENAPARHISNELQLRRSILACLLWEDQFYEDGVEIAGRIAELVPKVEPERVAALAIEAREQMKLRHAPLLLVREMARHKTHRGLVAETLDRGGPIKLRDVLFLSHAKPRDDQQAGVWKKLIWGRLAVPDTWEIALSAAGADNGVSKREAWTRLVTENKLGALALLRNLRNLREAGVDEKLVLSALESMNTQRVLPFRFLAAARYAPQWEPALEAAMLKCVAEQPKLAGRTVLLIDISGSMMAPLSRRSEMLRTDAAYGLAVLLREIGERVAVYSFSDNLVEVPGRRGFALRDAIDASQRHNGTYLGKAVEQLNKAERYDRLIVITDEQAHDTVPNPQGKGYVINVASYKNGVGYGKWTHIDGWSESVVEYIRTLEKTAWVS